MLQANFIEAIKVEKDLASLRVNQGNDKPSTSRNPIKTHKYRREHDAFDIEGLQMMVKKLSNEIINVEKKLGESMSGRGFFRFPKKKHFPSRQHPPPKNINIQDYTMDNFCRAHKDNHLEKNCLDFINMFELFTISQMNPPPSEKNKNMEIQEDPSNELSINQFWDLCGIFKGEEEPNIEEIQTTQHTHHTRSKGSMTQSNPYVSNNDCNTPENSQKKTMTDKAVTIDIIVNKNHSPINTTTNVEIDFSIVEELK